MRELGSILKILEQATQDLALQQSIVKHKTSLLETLCYTMEKLLVTESEANPNHCVSSGDIVLALGHPAGSLKLYQFFRN